MTAKPAPPRKQRLKVYRTEAGFHDAYVAAPSMKAALKAWGARGDLFHQQAAQVVTDPGLTAEPLARPGEIILRPRGGLAEHVKAASRPARTAKAKSARDRKPAPPPSRSVLEAAEAAITKQLEQGDEELGALDREIEALRARRDKLATGHHRRVRALRAKLDEAQADYDAALARWNEAQHD